MLGHASEAARLLTLADIEVVWEWTSSVLGANSEFVQVNLDHSATLAPEPRAPIRMPNAYEKRQLHERDGYHCRFCGIPVVRPEVRQRLRTLYPHVVRWGKKNAERHAAFFAMRAQYDHLLPHARGGTNELSNLVVTCSACNYGRGGYTLAEVGLRNPMDRPPRKSTWDGLERIFCK